MKKILAMLLAAVMLALPAAADEAGEPVVTSVEEEAVVVEEAAEEAVVSASIFKLYVLDASDNTILGYIDETSAFQLISASLFGIENVALVVDELAEGYTITYNDAALELGVITAPIPVEAFTSINWTLSYAIDVNATMQYNNYIWIFGHPDNYVDVTAYITDAEGNTVTEVVLTNEGYAAAEDGDVVYTALGEIPEGAGVTFYVTADQDVAVTINGTAVNGYSETVTDVEDFEIAVTIAEETKTVTYTLAEEEAEESIHPISQHFMYGLVDKICNRPLPN
ncbi:MAG: hypothetical protein IJ037_06085 [Clostridia bacterium]|nr:hypothetical protein [Clostridia bacterium]MBQ8369425.1 hypothetical protein [Clostridia bacterium]MBQ8511754.1 hypothetical protein [Clostridia bacterium]